MLRPGRCRRERPTDPSVYFIRVCLAGVFFGLCALLFIEILRFFEWLKERITWPEIVQAALGGSGGIVTPISASIMAIELFGPYATVACVISFLMSGYRSVYPSQILQARGEQPPLPQPRRPA